MIAKYSKYLIRKEHILPIHLILEVTSACNSRCLTCFNWQKTDFKKERRMSLDKLEKILKSLDGLLWFSMTGGETFLRSDLPDIIKLTMKYNDPEFITIPTNCLLPDKIEKTVSRILEFYKKDLVITFSLDGVGSLHDKIRGVKGNFQKFLETYRRLKQLQKKYKNLHIGVNTVVNSLNQNKVKEIYLYVKDNLDVESHTFEIMRGCSRSSEIKAPSIEFYKKNKTFFKEIMKNKKYYRLSLSGSFMKAAKLLYHDIAFETLKQKKQLIPCYAGRLSAVIDCSGNVYPCELYKKFGNLGDVDFNFSKIWFSKRADEIRKEIKCRKCYCTHSCFQFVNILFNPRLYPKMIRYIL